MTREAPADWVVDAAGGRETFERLARGLSPSELWSVLLAIVRERSVARTAADVMTQYRRDRFVRPAAVDLRESIAVDGHLLAAANAFEAIELSPVAPLAACAAVAPTDQNRVLAALRGTEVVADPTNVLALECADRLSRRPDETVRLTTSMRVIRAQPVPDNPGFAQHFRIWVLSTAGRQTKDHAFTAEALSEQMRTMLDAFDRLEQHGYAFGPRRIVILATPERARLGDRIADDLRQRVPTERGLLEHAYYSGGVRAMLWLGTPDGGEVPIGDGGGFDWLGRLTSNRRNAYVASGMGAQLVPVLFRRSGS